MQDSQSHFDRRRFVLGGVTVFGGLYLLSDRARANAAILAPRLEPGEAPRTLLLVELSGGNDGLSTIVPYPDDVYHRSRTRTGVEAKRVLRIDDYHGFHPNLGELHQLFEAGGLAIVEGVGYPNPNHSHFTSQDIWHTARPTGRASGDGWIGRLLGELYPEEKLVPHAVHVGQTLPYSLSCTTHPVVCFDSPPSYRWAEDAKTVIGTAADGSAAEGAMREKRGSTLDRIRSIVQSAESSSAKVRRAFADYHPRVAYPADDFSQDLKTAAALLQSQIGCRVLSVMQGGYDTHEDQPRRHDTLMAELSRGLNAFLADVRGTEAGDKILVVVFSEFGRRVEDNASNGTDHGTAGPMFLAGTPVKGGFYGKTPSLQELHDGDLVHTTDFRSVYASVLQHWFGVQPEKVLGAQYPSISFLA